MSAAFRTDTLVNKTKKDHRCTWCNEKVEVGSQMVRVSGYSEDFWQGKFHPECWRAESAWFEQARRDRIWDETWPEEVMKRGTITDYYGDEITLQLNSAPLTKEEVAHPPKYLTTPAPGRASEMI